MPVRDGARYLPTAIKSLEAQSLRRYEVVVVDDGSQDETRALLEAWARRDDRVRIVRQPRRGLGRALDRGLRETRADIVARMDGDDLALPHRLEAQYEALTADPTLAALGTHVRLFPRSALREGMLRYERWLSSLVTVEDMERDLFIESPLVHPTVMARRPALVEVGGYRDVDGPEDYDLWLRLAAAGHRMANLPRVLLLWREHGDRARERRSAFDRLKLRHLLGWRLGGARRVVIWGAGPFGKSWSRRLRASGVEVARFVEVDPRKIGQTIHGAEVIAPEALPPPGELPVVVAVGTEGAREQIRDALSVRGYREPEHAVVVQ